MAKVPTISVSGGMGTHKHGVSGRSHNRKNALERTREMNKQLEQEAEWRKKKRGRLYESVKDLFLPKPKLSSLPE